MNRLAAALILACAMPALAADHMALMLKHWKVSGEFTIAVAELMPEADYDFKPNAEEMGFGALMIHIGDANVRNVNLVAGKTAGGPAKPEKTDKAAALAYLKESFDYILKTMATITPEDCEKLTGPAGRQLTGSERLWSYFTHTAHHRGQAEVYLRVKNIKPPAYRF